MPGDISCLALGVFYYSCYVLLLSCSSNIFRTSAPLSTPVAYVYIFAGETLSTLPMIPFACRNWTVRTPRRLAFYASLGLLLNLNFMAWRAAAAAMPLGAFSAITCAGVLLAPALTAALRRRCVSLVDVGGVLAATTGMLLVTHPPFLFGVPFSAPVYAYVLAGAISISALIVPFFFGATADEHWSNFLVLRLCTSAAVAVVCFGVAGGGSAFLSTPSTASVAAALVGATSTVYRLAQQVGCLELENFDAGIAGILGNIIHAGSIASTTLMAAAYFNETLTLMETVGVAVVFVAIIVVTLVKGYAKRKEERKEMEKIEEEVETDEEEVEKMDILDLKGEKEVEKMDILK